MTDYPDFGDSDDFVDDPDSPFFGLPTGQVPDVEPDPAQPLLDNVFGDLGIDSFDDIVVDFSDADPEKISGARFSNISDALRYLYDAGILNFSNALYDPRTEELGVEPAGNYEDKATP